MRTARTLVTCFDYNENGQLIARHQWKVPSKEENARNGLPGTNWRDAQYDKLGRITQAGSELFAFDPAHNILSDGLNTVPDNRLKTYNGTTYYYDDLGNLIHRELADGEVQNYFYDLHDQLVKAEIFKKDGTKETWAYTYDALGRRIGKGRLKDGEVLGSLENQTRFVWDGSHLLQETQPDGRYTYIYTDQDSYEPLAQVHNRTDREGESKQEINYFHCDQIGIPREMTDKDGNLLWFGNYTGWGRLKEETKVTDSAYQPFRLQNQYADRETGLHYNFFRYYEPDAGRFVNQDPIGLMGGDNLYAFAANVQAWIDPLGLSSVGECNDPCPGQPKTRMRHYTNTKGINGIRDANNIAASDQNLVFAVTKKQMKKNRSARDIEEYLGIKQGRGAHYVEFDACPGEFTPRKNSRDPKLIEHVYKGDLSLDGRNPIFK